MPFQFDPNTSEFTYKGKTVGSWRVEKGQGRVLMDITYDVDEAAIDVIELLSRAGVALKEHARKTPPLVVACMIETGEDDIEFQVQGARQTLVEVTVKRDNYQWRFHLNDADPWPSIVHGHDYDRRLKIDAFTGKIYDTSTKNHCATLKKKKLDFIVIELKKNPEFKSRLESSADKSLSSNT